MKSTFEKLGGTYKQVGDYLLPDVEAPESPKVGALGAAAVQVSAGA